MSADRSDRSAPRPDGRTPGSAEGRRTDVERFGFLERVVHWWVGLSFLYLLLTGLALSHPRLYWLTSLSGGGPLTRMLHPWVGLFFTVGLGAMVFVWARDMGLDRQDREWLGAVGAYATRDKARVPPAGKYNAGQKLFFWLMGALGAVHLVSGIPLWFPAGIGGLGPFGASAVNAMRLLHYATTVGGGLLLIVHVYLGTIAYPGTLGAMLHGHVTRAWARLHHPRWKPDEGR